MEIKLQSDKPSAISAAKSKRFILSCLVIVGCTALYFGYRSFTVENVPPGFCKEQQRYIADREFIDRAVRERDTRWGSLPRYANRDFDLKNHNCCRVRRGGDISNLKEVEQIEGEVVEVVLNNQTSRTEVRRSANFDVVVLSVCGNFKHMTRGY